LGGPPDPAGLSFSAATQIAGDTQQRGVFHLDAFERITVYLHSDAILETNATWFGGGRER